MAIRIITDTASDITREQAEQLGVELFHMVVRFGDDCYRDGIDINHRIFFEKLIESDELPHTSQIPPAEYEETFDKSDDDVICVVLSSKLSGSYQSACLAAQERKNVYVIDSENVCVAQMILVELAVRLRSEGLTAAEIAARLEDEKHKIRILALLDTLEYLRKGGRISKAAAFAGGLLSIKPVVTVENGEVVLLGKARGSKNGNNMLISLTKQEPIDFDKPYHLAYSGLSDELLNKYIEDSRDLYPCEPNELPRASIGSIIGTHVGPGAIAVAFFVK